MLNFRNTNIIFALLLAGFIAFDIMNALPVYYYLALALLYSLVLFWGSYFVHSQFYMKTICRAITTEKKVAITFDDGPAEKHTPEILAILSRFNAPATFFCIGRQAAAHKELLRQIHEQGHIIGSHSYAHGVLFDLLSAGAMQADLQKAQEVFSAVSGKKVQWFRPPYGVTNPNLKKAVQKMGYTAIGWSVRSMDTVAKHPPALLSRLKALLKPGAVFLFHDTAAITVEVLPQLITYIQEQGYEVAPLDKLLNLQPYAD